MTSSPTWQEVESKVHRPSVGLLVLVGAVFMFAGGAGFLTVGFSVPPGTPLLLARLLTGAFFLGGGAVLAAAVKMICWPVYVRHAAPDVLPDVPAEPVVCEGSVVMAVSRMNCARTTKAGNFARRQTSGNDKRFLLGFGVPFLLLFSGLLTWVLHSQMKVAGWTASAVCGTLATAVCGGTALLLAGMLMRSGYRRLSTLTIPQRIRP